MAEDLKFGTLSNECKKVVYFDEEARAMAVIRLLGDDTMSAKRKAFEKCMPSSAPALRMLLTTFSASAASVIERRVANLGIDPEEFEDKVKSYEAVFRDCVKAH